MLYFVIVFDFLVMGFVVIYLLSIIILGRYFDKRRGFVNGIVIVVGSLGGFVIFIIFIKLMEEYFI